MRIKTFIILSLLFSFGCSTYEASYEQSPLIIDGLSSDWNTTLDSRNNNSYSYGISNDNENLYIRININDQSIQKKLILAGLTVWVDTTGKKKKNMGIICPTQKALPKMNKSGMKQMQSQQMWKKDQLLEIEFLGFKEYRESYFVSQNPYGVEVSIDQDEFKSLYYEMKIPFKSIYSDYSDIKLKTLSLGFETGALKMSTPGNNQTGMSNQPNSKSGGGKGGGRSGGMQGGGKGGKSGATQNSNAFSELTTPTSFWIKKINLASN